MKKIIIIGMLLFCPGSIAEKIIEPTNLGPEDRAVVDAMENRMKVYINYDKSEVSTCIQLLNGTYGCAKTQIKIPCNNIQNPFIY